MITHTLYSKHTETECFCHLPMILGASGLGVNSITIVLVGSVGSGTRPHSIILPIWPICYLMSFEISLILKNISFYFILFSDEI